ncbi:TetR family transcriptional regulator C-terminal domain-containing protein [Allosaccharopolyspora coralli]|uniref:TetR family transcriptional regulator C-terminal domain-containing protein n=1 Tax=Allosaccharopolyspora coralli TaxID=2665642 RepID=UPI001C9E7D14|nr:TetR family transcriptional regulator C-terminal domain-containing protein [Allosaccharopolyspora coralli]
MRRSKRVSQTATSTPLAAPLREHYAGLASFVAAQIERAQQSGMAATAREPNEEAAALLALVDGLSAHVLLGARSPEDVRRALEAHVDALFGPARQSR